MKQYRIKQKAEPLGIEYIVQVKFMWWWFNGLFPPRFNTIRDAQRYIGNLREDGKIVG